MSEDAGIREIIVQVGDLEAAVVFYTDVCGFTHLRTVREGEVEVAELVAGAQRVVLVPAAAPGVTLALDADEAAAGRLAAADVITERTEGTQGVWTAFTDPWGNRLGYFQAR